jgi:hypothetical protein
MKIWVQDNDASAYRNVKLHCEEHSDYEYLGDLNDDEVREYLLNLQPNADVEKNLKLLHYYGYLHLFIVKS